MKTKTKMQKAVGRFIKGTIAVMLLVILNINPIVVFTKVLYDTGVISTTSTIGKNLWYILTDKIAYTEAFAEGDIDDNDPASEDDPAEDIKDAEPVIHIDFPEFPDYSEVLNEINKNVGDTSKKIDVSNAYLAQILGVEQDIYETTEYIKSQLGYNPEIDDPYHPTTLKESLDDLSHQYRVAHVRSLNNEFGASLWQPTLDELPDLQSYVEVTGQFASVYMGNWDITKNMITDGAVETNRNIIELGYDILVDEEAILPVAAITGNVSNTDGVGYKVISAMENVESKGVKNGSFNYQVKTYMNGEPVVWDPRAGSDLIESSENPAIADIPTSEIVCLHQKLLNEKHITWGEAVRVLYRALGQEQVTYICYIAQDPTITTETSPAVQGLAGVTQLDGYTCFVFATRAELAKGLSGDKTNNYWANACNAGFVLPGMKDKEISYIDFYNLAKQMMLAYGEKELTDVERNALLAIYGSSYPIELGRVAADSWAYLKAKGIIKDENDPMKHGTHTVGNEEVEYTYSDTLTKDDLLSVCAAIKNEDLRATYKEINLALVVNDIVYNKGYFPVYDVELNVQDNVQYSTVIDFSAAKYYTYLFPKISESNLGTKGIGLVTESIDSHSISDQSSYARYGGITSLDVGSGMQSFYVVEVSRSTPKGTKLYLSMYNSINPDVYGVKCGGSIDFIEFEYDERGGIYTKYVDSANEHTLKVLQDTKELDDTTWSSFIYVTNQDKAVYYNDVVKAYGDVDNTEEKKESKLLDGLKKVWDYITDPELAYAYSKASYSNPQAGLVIVKIKDPAASMQEKDAQLIVEGKEIGMTGSYVTYPSDGNDVAKEMNVLKAWSNYVRDEMDAYTYYVASKTMYDFIDVKVDKDTLLSALNKPEVYPTAPLSNMPKKGAGASTDWTVTSEYSNDRTTATYTVNYRPYGTSQKPADDLGKALQIVQYHVMRNSKNILNTSQNFRQTTLYDPNVLSAPVLMSTEQILIEWGQLCTAGLVQSLNPEGGPCLDQDMQLYYFSTRLGTVYLDNLNHTIQIGSYIYNIDSDQDVVLQEVDETSGSIKYYIDLRAVTGQVNNNNKIPTYGKLSEPSLVVTVSGRKAINLASDAYNMQEGASTRSTRIVPFAEVNKSRIDYPEGYLLLDSGTDNTHISDGHGNDIQYKFDEKSNPRYLLSSIYPCANWLTVTHVMEDKVEAGLFVYYPKVAFTDGIDESGNGKAALLETPNNAIADQWNNSNSVPNISLDGSNADLDNLYAKMNSYAIGKLYELAGSAWTADDYIVRYFDLTSNSAFALTVPETDFTEKQSSRTSKDNKPYSETVGAIYYLEDVGFVYNIPTVEQFTLPDYFTGKYPLPLAYDKSRDIIINYNMNSIDSMPYGWDIANNKYVHYKGQVAANDITVQDINITSAPAGVYSELLSKISNYHGEDLRNLSSLFFESYHVYFGTRRVTLADKSTTGFIENVRILCYTTEANVSRPIQFEIPYNLQLRNVNTVYENSHKRTRTYYIIQASKTQTVTPEQKVIETVRLERNVVQKRTQIKDLLELIDAGSNWIIYVIITIFPIIAIIWMTLLVGLSFITDSALWQKFSKQFFDPIKILTFGARTSENWYWRRVLLPCVITTCLIALFCNANILRIIIWLLDAYMRFANAI